MTIRTADQEGTVQITIDRPPVNALDLESILDLELTFSALARAAPTNGVVLTGSGGVFTAGVDTRAFSSYDREQRTAMVHAITRMVAALLAIPVPVVAAVNGHALGGGFVLMLAFDYRIAMDSGAAKFGMPEARSGIPFPAGPLEVIRHELGPELLRRMALAGAAVDVKELHRLGVIDELCAAADLLATAHARAKALAGQPAFRIVKQQIRGELVARVTALAVAGLEPHLGAFL